MRMVHWRATGCVGWFPYSNDNSDFLTVEEYHATERDHSQFAEYFLPPPEVVSIGSFHQSGGWTT